MSEITAKMIERGAGADPDARRRRSDARRLREVRARMGARADVDSPVGHPAQDEIDRWVEVAAARRRIWLVAAGLTLVVGGFAALAMPWAAALAWTVAALLGLAAAGRVGSAFLAEPADPDALAMWRRRFVVSDVALGLVWGALTLFRPALGDPGPLAAILAWGGLATMAAVVAPRALVAALAPMAGVLAFDAATAGSVRAALPCAAALLGLATFAAAAQRLRAGASEGLVFRRRKDLLIAELEQANAESDDARRRAEQANVAKSQFLATMSHELRTPLNAILGFSEVMQGELFGAHAVRAYREYSADIHASGQHLLNLINEILDLSRVEAGRYELREEPVSLGHVVEDSQTLIAMRARAKSIALSVSVAPDLPRVWADERALRQIALNLMSNAVKFTPAGGKVAVKVGWTASGGQYLSIKDDGPGIPEHELPLVMSAFGRGDMALRQAEEGSGLGLPIVKGLVELHGGVFTLKSRLREGTEAVVVLPAERALSPLSPLATDGRTPKRRA